MRKIGILTGGGDCPGLNAVIRGVVARCIQEDIAVFGFYAGWRGVLEDEGRWLTRADVEGIQTLGGTILGSSRTNVMKFENGPQMVRDAMERLELEGLVAVGGDDTLGVANTLRKLGMNMIGVPKTIDNDLSCTDWTFGFDTASNIAMEEIDRLHTTAESHERCFVVECMGRHTGWITLQAGVAANAHMVLIPEFPLSFDEIYSLVRERYVRGERYTIIAVAGGSKRELLGKRISQELEQIMDSRRIYQHSGSDAVPVTEGNDKLRCCVAAPILAEGDLLGLVLFISADPKDATGDTEYKLAQTIAAFLGRHMES